MSAADMLAALVASNLAMTAGILAVLVARRPVRRLAGARVSYVLWVVPLLVGLAGLLPARPTGVLPTLSAPIQPIAAAMVDAVDPSPAALPEPMVTPVAKSVGLAFDPATALLAIWAAGVVAMLALTAIRQRRSLRAFGAIERGDRSMRASANAGPALVGVLFPRLVVPADFEQRFTEQERTLILAHERAHLSSGDTRINALVALLTCINWFNPLVHIAARLVRTDQELACDAAVVERFPGERRIYAEALLKTQIAPASLPLGCTWPPRSSSLLKERVMMLARETPRPAARIGGVLLISLAALGGGLAAWAQKPAPAETASREDLGPVKATVRCNAWNGRHSLDPKIRWDQVTKDAPLLLVFYDKDTKVTFPNESFPPGVYDHSTAKRGISLRTTGRYVYQSVSPSLIDTVTLDGLDRGDIRVVWQRFRVEETGAHSIALQGRCTRT